MTTPASDKTLKLSTLYQTIQYSFDKHLNNTRTATIYRTVGKGTTCTICNHRILFPRATGTSLHASYHVHAAYGYFYHPALKVVVMNPDFLKDAVCMDHHLAYPIKANHIMTAHPALGAWKSTKPRKSTERSRGEGEEQENDNNSDDEERTSVNNEAVFTQWANYNNKRVAALKRLYINHFAPIGEEEEEEQEEKENAAFFRKVKAIYLVKEVTQPTPRAKDRFTPGVVITGELQTMGHSLNPNFTDDEKGTTTTATTSTENTNRTDENNDTIGGTTAISDEPLTIRDLYRGISFSLTEIKKVAGTLYPPIATYRPNFPLHDEKPEGGDGVAEYEEEEEEEEEGEDVVKEAQEEQGEKSSGTGGKPKRSRQSKLQNSLKLADDQEQPQQQEQKRKTARKRSRLPNTTYGDGDDDDGTDDDIIDPMQLTRQLPPPILALPYLKKYSTHLIGQQQSKYISEQFVGNTCQICTQFVPRNSKRPHTLSHAMFYSSFFYLAAAKALVINPDTLKKRCCVEHKIHLEKSIAQHVAEMHPDETLEEFIVKNNALVDELQEQFLQAYQSQPRACVGVEDNSSKQDDQDDQNNLTQGNDSNNHQWGQGQNENVTNDNSSPGLMTGVDNIMHDFNTYNSKTKTIDKQDQHANVSNNDQVDDVGRQQQSQTLLDQRHRSFFRTVRAMYVIGKVPCFHRYQQAHGLKIAQISQRKKAPGSSSNAPTWTISTTDTPEPQHLSIAGIFDGLSILLSHLTMLRGTTLPCMTESNKPTWSTRRAWVGWDTLEECDEAEEEEEEEEEAAEQQQPRQRQRQVSANNDGDDNDNNDDDEHDNNNLINRTYNNNNDMFDGTQSILCDLDDIDHDLDAPHQSPLNVSALMAVSIKLQNSFNNSPHINIRPRPCPSMPFLHPTRNASPIQQIIRSFLQPRNTPLPPQPTSQPTSQPISQQPELLTDISHERLNPNALHCLGENSMDDEIEQIPPPLIDSIPNPNKRDRIDGDLEYDQLEANNPDHNVHEQGNEVVVQVDAPATTNPNQTNHPHHSPQHDTFSRHNKKQRVDDVLSNDVS